MRGLVLVCSLIAALAGCRSSDSSAKQPERGAADEAPAQASAETAEADASPAAAKPARPSKIDPEHGDKLRDLDDLCASVDHDYKDGTLGDYYSGLKLRTTWGEDQRARGLESIQPGRLLEAAVNEVDPDRGDPALTHCHTLLGYLDDVE